MAWLGQHVHLYAFMDMGPIGETKSKTHEVRPLATPGIWLWAYEAVRHAHRSDQTSSPTGCMTDAMRGGRPAAGVHDLTWKQALKVELNKSIEYWHGSNTVW